VRAEPLQEPGQFTPTARLTPHAAAAASVDNPVATRRQNPRSASRPRPGRPGERITGRPVTSEAQPFGRPIRTSNGALRRPVETTQYTSIAFSQRLQRLGLTPSMGSRGDAFDNAVSESWHASLQTELLDRHRWSTRNELRTAIFHYIEVFYNRRRLHSSLDHQSPDEFGRRYAHARAVAS